MIRYPHLSTSCIGVTAPSSGVPEELHELVRLASRRMEQKGFSVFLGETVWTQEKVRSAPAGVRAAEFMEMMENDQISLIVPPWGGELLIEVLDYIDFSKITPKWILGYSDLSVLLLAVTLKTGIATAHGTNLIDLRGEKCDETTSMWERVLRTEKGKSVLQHSSDFYQREWNHSTPSPYVFHLTEQTDWKTPSETHEKIHGRLLGGCIDVIRHLIGTPYGDLAEFKKNINNDPILWYFENCELSATDLRRSLIQMRLAGWFQNCSGIVFGRSAANKQVNGYTAEDVYQEIQEELQIPIIYDIDCGHVPPQITLVNGAYAEVEAIDGKGTIKQVFKP